SAAGDDADAHFGETRLRGGIHDAQVARERQLASAAERETVDRGDPRFRTALQLSQLSVQLAQPVADVVFAPAAPFFEIRSGAESARPRARDHHRADPL